MAEYIEREALYKKLLELEALARARVLDTPTTSPTYQRYSAQLTERVQMARMVEDAPAADVAPVVHGKISCVKFRHIADWFGECSLCGKSVYFESNYCPHCGAKMDKEATDGLDTTLNHRPC